MRNYRYSVSEAKQLCKMWTVNHASFCWLMLYAAVLSFSGTLGPLLKPWVREGAGMCCGERGAYPHPFIPPDGWGGGVEEGQESGSRRGTSGWSVIEGKENGKKKGDERLQVCREILRK